MTDSSCPQSIRDALGDAGLAKLEAAGERVVLPAGTVLSEPGDPIDELCLILRGAVEVFLVLDGDVERLVGTLRDRGLLGAIAVAEPMPSGGRARTSEETELIRISRDALQDLLRNDSELALAVWPAIAAQMARQARIAIDDLVNTGQWAAQVAGISQVGFGDLLAGPDGVVLRLVDGRSLSGRLLRIDLTEGSGYLVIDDGEGTLHVVRGAGIVSLERPPVGGPEA